MEKVRFISYLVIVSIIGSVQSGFAQSGVSNARSVAMGGAYTAVAAGVEAPFWNPANLALPGSRKPRFNLVSVGVGLQNNSFTLEHYNLYNGEHLSETDKQDILSHVPGEGWRMNMGTEVQALGFAIGNVAVTASGYAASDFGLSKDMLDLMLNGNEFERLYDIGTSFGEGWGASSFAVSIGLPTPMTWFKKSTFGISAKYLRGFAYGKVREASSTLITDIEGLHGSGRLVIDHALGGNGFALDVGMAAQVTDSWTMSMSLLNAFNYINWSKDPKQFVYTFSVDSLALESSDDATIDSLFTDGKENVGIEPFSASQPAQLRLGVAHTGRRLVLALDVAQGLRDGAGVSTTPRVAVGSEFRVIDLLPLRGGIAIGGQSGFTVSTGFGFELSVFSWNFALASMGGSFGGRSLGAAFDWMLWF